MRFDDEWKQYTLGEILVPKGYIRGPFGSALKRNEMLTEGIPVYEQQHAIYGIRDFRFFIDDKKLEEMKRFQVQTDDLIISCSGTVGKVSIIEKEDQKGIISQALLLLRVNRDIILPQYLKYFFLSKEGHASITSRSSGSVQVNISKRADIEKISLRIPSIAKQQEIVAILSVLDDKINNNNKINQRLEETARAIFKSWFIYFEPYQDEEFVKSELGYIPSKWSVAPLSAFCSFITRGITPKYTESGEQIVLNQKCIRGHQVNLGPSRYHVPKVINEKWLQFGDVLVNSTGQGTLGRVAQWLENATNVTVDSHISIVRPGEKYYIYYIGQFLMGKEREIESMAAGSTGQTELSRERLGSLLLVSPKIEQLREFSKLVEPMMIKIASNNHENEKLTKLRDTLLPKLLSGELLIPNAGSETNERSNNNGRSR